MSRYQKKHSPTHTPHGHHSVIPYLPSPTIMIHGILPVQFTGPTVFIHNLSPSFLWSTSWPGTLHFILHTLLHPIIVFLSSTCKYHHNLLCCSTEIMSSNPSLSQLFTWNSSFTLSASISHYGWLVIAITCCQSHDHRSLC